MSGICAASSLTSGRISALTLDDSAQGQEIRMTAQQTAVTSTVDRDRAIATLTLAFSRDPSGGGSGVMRSST